MFGRAPKPASILNNHKKGIFSRLEECTAALAEEEDADAGAESDLLKLGSFIREISGKKDSSVVQFIERALKRLKADKARAAAAVEEEEDQEEEEDDEEEDTDPGAIRRRRADAAEGRIQKRQKIDPIVTYNELMGDLHPVIRDLLHE
ncbi:hypothetical protein HDU86_004683 [Geranomyces michiganensis]|nr:hypothetical protein HDU86_004683 [Geranomyces michiganensis]